MVIGIFTDTFLPIINGVGRISYEYALNLHKRGHEVHVITPCPEKAADTPFFVNSFKAKNNPFVPRYRSGIPKLDKLYRKTVETVKFDILHAHSLGIAGKEAFRLSKLMNIPLVGTFHTDYYQTTLNTTGSRMIADVGKMNALKCCRLCTEIWPVSNKALEILTGYGYTGPTHIMRNGTGLPAANPDNEFLSRKYGIGKQTKILLYAGEIHFKNKNLFKLIEALEQLDRENADYRMIFTGGGKDSGLLKDIMQTKNLKNVIYYGHESDKNTLDSIYSSADLLVFPSIIDTAGMVVYEAAACGTPALVMKDSAPGENITHLKNGLISENDAADMKIKISGFLKNDNGEIGKEAEQSLPYYWPEAILDVEKQYLRLIAANIK